MVDPSGGDQNVSVLFLVFESVEEFDFVIAFGFVLEEVSQIPSQRVDVMQKDRIDQSVGSKVHTDLIFWNRSGQNPSVAGQNITPIGLDSDPFVGNGSAFAA